MMQRKRDEVERPTSLWADGGRKFADALLAGPLDEFDGPALLGS
jgi:hypothetical protein